MTDSACRVRKISPATSYTPPKSNSRNSSRKSSNTDSPNVVADIWDNRHSNSVAERIEQWLDDHPEFTTEYFVKKATRDMVDQWLQMNNTLSSRSQHYHHIMNSNVASLITGSTSHHAGIDVSPSIDRITSSSGGSGSNTPIRKISAQEFYGSSSKPIVVTGTDGSPTFINDKDCRSTKQLKSQFNLSFRRSRHEIRHLDERELMHEVILDICNDLELNTLCFKILQNICLLLRADRCSLFLIQDTPKGRMLVSELFDITEKSTFAESREKSDEKSYRVPLGTGIMGHVALTGEYLNIKNAYQDSRFNPEIDLQTGYRTRSILCMPLKDNNGEVLGVAQVVNKADPSDEPFTDKDVKIFESYLAFCAIGLRNAQLFHQSNVETRRNQVLLDLARLIFEEQSDLGHLIHRILVHTQSLLQCERCQVLLVEDLEFEKGIFSHAFDLCASDLENDDVFTKEKPEEDRFPLNLSITGHVAKTGEILNLSDAYEDERFDQSSDTDGFRTRAILCTPIRNSKSEVLGVFLLVNKVPPTNPVSVMNSEPIFSQSDQHLLEALAIFCGLGIHNTQMFERAMRAVAKQRVALEVLSYHAIAPIEEAQKLRKMLIPSSRYYKLTEFAFTDFSLTDDDTLKACLRMFIDLDLVSKFRIPYNELCRWLLSVKKNYRNVTYHNWRHAFNVAQTMFAMIKNSNNLNNVLDDVDRLSLMIACLCHDLDHRGTNNQFQIKTMSPLAELYSTSVLEHHHFDQCIMILTTKGNDILSQIKPQKYALVIKGIEQSILATDLAKYFSNRNTFFDLVNVNNDPKKTFRPDWSIEENRYLLKSMLMTACDVAAITKPWPVQKKIAELVANEFFEQGDIEKSELKITPIAMMDRDKQDQLPKMQVEFIDFICLPVYKAIARAFPQLQPLLDGCFHNRECWEELSKKKCTDI